MSRIVCRDVTMYYDRRLAVDHVSFTAEAGDFIGIVGENGTGKSTLVKGLLGLKKPDGGSIVYEDMRPSDVGYLPQQTPVQQDFPASVEEVVRSGCLGHMGWRPWFRRAEKRRAAQALAQAGLTAQARTPYRDLSGGQQQRVLLARALCAAGKVLLLDEPAASLDPLATADWYERLRRLNREQGLTILMVSHDLRGAVGLANKILHMHTSRAYFGPVGDYVHTELYRRMTGGDGRV